MPKTSKTPKTSKNKNLMNLRRLSGAATLKLDAVLRFSATALRDKILDETLNKDAEGDSRLARERLAYEGDIVALWAEGASVALWAARTVTVALGAKYQSAHLTGFSLRDWYQACGLDENGELHTGLFADKVA